MELFQLRYFLEVAKRQHVRKSAEVLNITQPALTRAIHNLEKELNVRLFTTYGRNIRLTESGEYFRDELEPLMDSISRLKDSVREMSDREQLTVRINLLAAWTLVGEAILEYQRIDDELRLELIAESKSERSDISVTTVRSYNPAIARQSADRISIFREDIYLAVPNSGRFRGLAEITLQEVAGEKFISLDGSKSLRSICDTFCAGENVRPNIVFESDTPESVKSMIAANLGVGFWPAFSWGKVDDSRVRLLKIAPNPLSRDIVLSLHPKRQNCERVRLFYDFLAKYIEQYRGK